MDDNRPRNDFIVLSLDGGGVKGLLTARILCKVETYLRTKGLDGPLGSYVDLVVGTSTGGIIALGLAAGLSAQEILAFYEKTIPLIFRKRWHSYWPWYCFRPKYSSAPLASALKDVFGERTLRDVTTDVCITSVDLTTGKPRLHKSDYMGRNAARLDETIADIALATSAAPTFFPAHTATHSANLVDGAICANNPAIIALVEALQFERPSKRGTQPPKSLDSNMILLSIGTGEQAAMPYTARRLKAGGLFRWAPNVHEIVFESQSQAAHHQAKLLLRDRYLRINPPLKISAKIDDTACLSQLVNPADLTKEQVDFVLNRLVRRTPTLERAAEAVG